MLWPRSRRKLQEFVSLLTPGLSDYDSIVRRRPWPNVEVQLFLIRELFGRTGLAQLVFVVATGGGVCGLILAAGIGIESTFEGEKISEEL